MTEPFENFIRVANFFYTCIGIQPFPNKSTSEKKLRVLKILFFLLAINLNLQLVGQITSIYDAFKTKTGFIEAIFTASVIGFITVSDAKTMSIWIKKKTLKSLIHKLKKIHPNTVEDQKAYKLKTYVRHATIVGIMFSSLYTFLIWTFNLLPLRTYIFDRVTGRKFERKFPYNTYVPWEWHDNASYWMIYTSQIVAAYMAGAGIISSDTLLCALVTLVCMHYDFICKQLEEYVPSGDEKDMQFIGGMIAYHQKVLAFSDQINSIFGISLLCNFAASSFIICFVGFQVTAGLSNEDFCKFLLYLLSALIQVFLICYYGEMMTQASGNIAPALYNQVWYMKATKPYKKCLLGMMHKAQKPVHLMATVFFPVSMQAFTEIGQVSYKFFTLLRTMYTR